MSRPRFSLRRENSVLVPAPLPVDIHARLDEHAAILKQQAQQIADLTARIENDGALSVSAAARIGPRDGADVRLLAAITLSIGSVVWTCAQLFRHADTEPAIQHALQGADITTPIELGILLSRCEGRAIDGRVVRRARLRRGRARWWVELVPE